MSLWPSPQTADASGASVTPTAPELEAGEVLSSSTCSYSILEFIGEGCFGKVARCQRLHTNEAVAVKILKDTEYIQDTEKEVSMLEHIRVLNPDHTNVVKFFEHFDYMGQTCLAFEMLDCSLYDLLLERNWNPLTVKEVRPIAQQMLVALDALKGLGVLHTDIKPDNVMLVDQQDQPFRLKLIDFGTAIFVSDVQPGLEIQPAGYRAPEVALGLPFTESIDVWGVGCVLAFVYLAENLFPVHCDYQMMKRMVEVMGQPEDHLLCAGQFTKCFFRQEEAADGPAWRLMTPDEYTVANDIVPEEESSHINLPSSLDDLVNVYPKEDDGEFEDRAAFINLLKQLLHPIGDQRVSPLQALQHSFFTISHLTELPDSSDDLTTSRALMSCCPMEESDPAAWSEGELPNVSDDEDPSDWSEGELPNVSDDEDPSDWSEGELPNISDDEDPSDWSEGELPNVSDDEDPAAWSEGELPNVSCDAEPSDCSDEGLAHVTCDREPSDWTPEGSQPEDFCVSVSSHERQSLSDDEDLSLWSSDGILSSCSSDGATTDCTAAASASSGRNLLDSFRKFFSRVAATFSCCCSPTVEY